MVNEHHESLGLFTEREAKQFDNLVALMTDYLERKNPPRPLCLAVFGAPGSGKSRLVKAIPKHLKEKDVLAPLAEINLTQVTSIDALAGALDAAKEAADEKVPFVFFDEFDSAHDGAPWGWLSWFLAPMQDGEFRSAGKRVKLKRAIYVFAGGTASLFEQFGTGDTEAFALAKGPDFISRLRGYLNIPGVNADKERLRRRHAVLDYELSLHKDKKLTSELKTALLHVGRYRHGARSIGALLELLPQKDEEISVEDIREHFLLRMHIDRGPLDPGTIGGCIGVSSGDSLAGNFPDVWNATCESMFRDGATLACGGREANAGLRQQLQTAMQELPTPLEPAGQRWLVTAALSEPSDTSHEDPRVGMLRVAPVSSDELPMDWEPDAKERLTATLTLFRMRYQLALCCVAQFAIGGSLTPPSDPARWKRFPGVVEELMLAIALKHPVYISGALQGGAMWAGVLLGLGRSWTGPLPGFDRDWFEIPTESAILFRPPVLGDLPLRRAELIEFFRNHALGGPNWVDNGLSSEENRKLFELTDAKEIASLVVKGLRERFDRVGRASR